MFFPFLIHGDRLCNFGEVEDSEIEPEKESKVEPNQNAMKCVHEVIKITKMILIDFSLWSIFNRSTVNGMIINGSILNGLDFELSRLLTVPPFIHA